MKALKIGNKIASIPIIQGGMGVGVSRSSLAGAVAREGGIGVISTAQIGYDEEDFEGHERECNLRAIDKHIARAKELAQGAGLVGVNIMVALKHYKEHVKEAREPIVKCYQCLEHCNPAKVPYCITKALVNAVKGDLDHGLIFCGANVGRIKK